MRKKTVIVITSGILATEIIWQLYKAYRCFREKAKSTVRCKPVNTKIKEKIFEVMFFSDDSTLCRPHANMLVCRELCMKSTCAATYLRRIRDYLDTATDTLSICMFFFTCEELAQAVGRAVTERGVTVKIILDETMMQNKESQIVYFYKQGIEIRFKQIDSMMHHKFVIIDEKILITGSVNWTMNGFFGNFENMIITNESALVEPYVKEFERIWLMFD